jgi:hypothetical protein
MRYSLYSACCSINLLLLLGTAAVQNEGIKKSLGLLGCSQSEKQNEMRKIYYSKDETPLRKLRGIKNRIILLLPVYSAILFFFDPVFYIFNYGLFIAQLNKNIYEESQFIVCRSVIALPITLQF